MDQQQFSQSVQGLRMREQAEMARLSFRAQAAASVFAQLMGEDFHLAAVRAIQRRASEIEVYGQQESEDPPRLELQPAILADLAVSAADCLMQSLGLIPRKE